MSDYLSHNGQEPDIEVVQGMVGEGPAAAFMGYIRVYQDLVSIEDLFDGKRDLPEAWPKEMDQRWALTTAIAAHYLAEPSKRAQRAVELVSGIPDEEFGVVAMKDCLTGTARGNKPISKTKGYIEWVKRHADVVLEE